MTVSSEKINWIDLINESVYTSDDVDIGDIVAVSRDFVVVKRGFINIHYYYIPISKVEGWDGDVLWLKITEEQVKRNYERNIVPDPSRYYVKDYPYYSTAYYPALARIPHRYQSHIFPAPPSPTAASTLRSGSERTYKCDICEALFKTEDDFSEHVKATH
jgi:hypothetical protein